MSDSATPPVRLRPEVLAVPAYRQGAAPTKPGFKLSSNENPFDPLPSVLAALQGRGDVNRYASAAMPELRESIARRFGVGADHVHLGAGSVAILYQLVHAAAGHGAAYLHAWPSFEAYPSLGLASGAEAIRVPLNERAEHDLDAMAAAITPSTRVILLCTPNNPTGPAIRRDDFDRFMERVPADTLVVLDEAYREFVTDPAAVRGEDVLGLHENLVVLRTFSKAYGLAGLRVGYGIGHPAILSAAATAAIPLSVTGLAETAALASLSPDAQAESATRIAEITERRDELMRGLRDAGLDVPDAQGNFVWVPETAAGAAGASDAAGGPAESERVDGVDSATDGPARRIDTQALADAFAESGTLVRPFPGEGVRISVGEAESIAEVLRVVRGFLEG